MSTPFCPERKVRTWGRELGGQCLVIRAGAGLPQNLESCRHCRGSRGWQVWNSADSDLSLSAFARTGCTASGSCLLSEPDFLPSVTCGGSPHICLRQPVFENQINTQCYHQPGLGTGSAPGPWILLSSSMVLRYRDKGCFPNTDHRPSRGSRHISNDTNTHNLPLLKTEHCIASGITLFGVSPGAFEGDKGSSLILIHEEEITERWK